MKGNYSLPKYRKGQKVVTPDGEGHILQIAYEGGANWYRVKEKFYGEVEIKSV
jgi:hypothetical protein